MTSQKRLVEYIRKGKDQGFRPPQIKEILLKKGIDEAKIDKAMDKALGYKKKSSTNLALLIAFILLTILLFFSFQSSDVEKTAPKEVETIEPLVENNNEPLNTEEYLDMIGKLSEEIDLKEKTIEEKLDLIDNINMTAAQKDDIIKEMKNLYGEIKTEREETRNMLIQLLKDIVNRANEPEVAHLEESQGYDDFVEYEEE